MSIDNNKIFNTYLILTATIVDIVWYIILTFLVTSIMAIDFIKNKSKLLHKFVGYIFILIGMFLILEFFI